MYSDFVRMKKPRKLHFGLFWRSKSHQVHYVWRVGTRKQCFQVVVWQHCHNHTIHVEPSVFRFCTYEVPERCILSGFGCQNHNQCTMFGRWGHVNNSSRLFLHPNDVVWQHCHNPNILVEPSVFRFCTYEETPKVAFWVVLAVKITPSALCLEGGDT